jgi:hypothetical protein
MDEISAVVGYNVRNFFHCGIQMENNLRMFDNFYFVISHNRGVFSLVSHTAKEP